MERRPCHGDAELAQREKDIEALKEKIYALEKELDQYLYAGIERRHDFNP